jgi:hypothetical protein
MASEPGAAQFDATKNLAVISYAHGNLTVTGSKEMHL